MILSQEYLNKNKVNRINTELSNNMKFMDVLVEFDDKPRYKFKLEVSSNFYEDIHNEIYRYITIKDRKKKIKRLKNKLRYDYFRRLFKRT
jgi:hypothetical protein